MEHKVDEYIGGPFRFPAEPSDQDVLALIDDPANGLPVRDRAEVINKVRDPHTGWQAQIWLYNVVVVDEPAGDEPAGDDPAA